MKKRKRPIYTAEFKARAVQLSAERNVHDVAEELEISSSSIIRWRGQMGVSPTRGTSDSLSAREMKNRLDELERENELLKKEKKIAEMERDILKKATAFFARESG